MKKKPIEEGKEAFKEEIKKLKKIKLNHLKKKILQKNKK